MWLLKPWLGRTHTGLKYLIWEILCIPQNRLKNIYCILGRHFSILKRSGSISPPLRLISSFTPPSPWHLPLAPIVGVPFGLTNEPYGLQLFSKWGVGATDYGRGSMRVLILSCRLPGSYYNILELYDNNHWCSHLDWSQSTQANSLIL